MSSIHIFIKSNCHMKPKRSFGAAAMAYIIQYPEQEKIEFSQGYYLSNSNRIELIAVLEALSQISEPSYIKVFSNNPLLAEGIEKFQQWQNEEWATCYAPDLWQKLRPFLIKHRISFIKSETTSEIKRCKKLVEKSMLKPEKYDLGILKNVDIADYLCLFDELKEELKQNNADIKAQIEMLKNKMNEKLGHE